MAARRRRHQVVDWPTIEHPAGASRRVQADIQTSLDRWWPITRCRTDGSPWWADVEPFRVMVACSGQRHTIRFIEGRLFLDDHSRDLDREATFARLAGGAGCFDVIDTWESEQLAPVDHGTSQFWAALHVRAIYALAHGDQLTPARREAVSAAASRDLSGILGEPITVWMDPDAIGLRAPWTTGESLTGGLPQAWFEQLWLRGLAVVDGRVIERIIHPNLGGGADLHVEVVRGLRYGSTAKRQGVIRQGSDGRPALWIDGRRVEQAKR